MRTIRIRGKLESAILDSPELADVKGKTVDLIVVDASGGNGTPDLTALDAIAGRDVIDEGAIHELRRASSI